MKKVRIWIPDMIYLLVWILLVGSFWSGLWSPGDAMGFSLLALYIALPITAFIAASLDGKRRASGGKWLFVAAAAALAVLCQSLTFDLANTLAVGGINAPRLWFAVPTGITAAAGMVIGSLYRRRTSKADPRKVEPIE